LDADQASRWVNIACRFTDEHLSGIAVDLAEDDGPGVRANYAAFASRYAVVRELVPEWEALYPTGPVEALGAALETGDRSRILGAIEAVGETCHRCHAASMVPVQQRYHWGDFQSIRMRDPRTGEAAAFAPFKRRLAASLTGIRVDLAQGQRDNALRQFEAFRAGFQELARSCGSCHDRERRDYVGPEAQNLLEELGRALADRGTAPETLTGLVQEIGRESCAKCHRVHLPAAMAHEARR
jgi:cytochrome c556